VFVSASGEVKLLDFGIAKLLDPTEDRLTRTNMIVMTPRYAAPEQRAGKDVTPATDVWQLGRLLREMVSAPLPRELETLAARASHDEPSRRYASAGPLAEDVRRFLAGQPVLARPDPLGYRLVRFARRRATLVAAVVLALAAGAAWKLTRRAPHFSDSPLRFQLVSTFPGSHRQASFSPDGNSIAFVMEDAEGTPQVWTKTLAGGDPVKRTSDPRSAHRPRWSPAGDAIVYDVPGQGIWSVPAAGGEARRIREEGFNASISPDGRRIVYEVDANLWTAGIDGSGARRLGDGARNTMEKEYAFVESTPAFSPDGRAIVYFQDHDGPVYGDLWSAPLDGGKPTRLTFDDVNTSHPTWMPDGSGIVYSSARRGGLTLWFWPAAGGEPRALTTGAGEDREAAVSRDGRRLIYTNARNLLRILWLDPKTGERRQLLENRAVATHPAFSPDGRRVAVFQGEGRNLQLWAVRNDGAEPRQITFGDKNRSIVPEWSRNGRFLYHYLFPGGGFSRTPVDGGATEVLIPGWTHMVMHGAHVSPDERRVAYTQMEHSVPVAARVRDLATGAEHALAEPIIWPRWSPDGTTIAGRSRERELMLCPASGEACKGLRVEGTEPRWSGDGQLYFVRYSGYQGSRDSRAVPVFRIGKDGRGLTKIAELEGPSPVNFFYDVSPTGEIAWASFVPGRQELWMADLQPQSK
jgi:Tol biopolymer transport system component